HAPRGRAVRGRRSVALALDPAAARGRSLLHRRARTAGLAQIESGARMAHNAEPAQKLRGGKWRNIRTLLPYVLEYKWRVLFALLCLISAKLANVGVPLIMKEVVDRLEGASQIGGVPAALAA